MAGLIAARMLSDLEPVVCEKQKSLPNNHAALLRFRTEEVSIATNIPFQKVQVIKAVHGSVNPVSDAIRYSRKVTGKIQSRSILDLEPVSRWVAPYDFIGRLAKQSGINYGIDFQDWSHNLIREGVTEGIVSTIPMPAMMDLFKWPDRPVFNSQSGWTANVSIKPELRATMNATIYYPGDEPYYRASVTGSRIMIEGVGEELPESSEALSAISDFGIRPEDLCGYYEIKPARFQKIDELTVPERESAKRFIMWLSNEHKIFSLGRFATWRPKLLLDDIVNDVRVIRKLIESGNGFDSLAL